MIEGHRRFSVAEAIKIGHELAEYDPTWFEEPTDHAKIDATARSRAKLPIPVSAGESFTSTHQFAELLAHNTVHILQPDPSNLGGILSDADGLRDGRCLVRRGRAASGAGTDLDRRLRPDRRLHAEPADPGAVRRVQRRLGARDRHLAPRPWPRTARSIFRLVRVSAAISYSASWRSTRTRPAISCRSSRLAGRSGKASNRLSRRPTRTRSRSDDD